MRTLRVAPYFEPAVCYGGPAVSVPAACRALARAGTPVTVYTTTANGAGELDVEPGVEVDRGGVKVRYFPRIRPRGYFRSPRLGAELLASARDFDLMHLHGVFCHTNWAAFRAARRHCVPYVVTIHGCLDPAVLRQSTVRRLKKAAYIAAFERRVLAHAGRLIALTESERSQIAAFRFGPPVVVLPNGLDPARFDCLPSRGRAEALCPAVAGHPYVLFLSRLHPKKGLDLLLKAFAALVRQRPEWRLIVAGPDEDGCEAGIRTRTVHLGLGPVVEFVGPVYGQEKLSLLGNADLFCLPSRSEGLPTVVVEALFCGRPVLITETCYMPAVAAAEAGLVVPATSEALARGLVSLAADASAREQMGRRARRLALREYDAAKVAVATQRVYEEVLEEHRRARR